MASKPSSIAVKFSGSLALLLTVAGILLAVGGQLDFLGNERSQPATPVAPQPAVVDKTTKPKYSFYDELKKRKSELDNQPTAAKPKPVNNAPGTENYRYVVQVGAFSYEKDAKTVQRRVDGLGYPSRIVKSTKKYLVQAGPFQGKNKADTAEKRLRGQKMDTLIKRLH